MMFSHLLSVVAYMATIHYELGCCSLSCLDDKGNEQDWYILYKIPKISNFNNKYIKVGEGYAYLGWKRNQPGQWILSDRSITDPKNHLMRTISQIGDKEADLSYLLYNDEDPATGRSGSKYGHTKGVLAVDAKRGFWIIHSIPRFPSDPRKSKVKYPKTGIKYGQTIMCISFNNNVLPKIMETFVYTVPFVYAHHAGEGLEDLDDEQRDLFSKKHSKTHPKAPWSYITDISSHSGSYFKIFGKNGNWKKDLYGELVAPNLKAPLRVETWSRGGGGILHSSCDLEFPVSNVEQIKINTTYATIDFSSKNDHSKWASTESGYEPYVCIGDINRVKSQWRRGGGTVCLKNNVAWKTFEKTASEIEQCEI